MPAPESVKELVERFERNLASYRSGKYNETQVRREFVDPLFEALGWDVTNRQGYAEAYKDVIHEDSIRIGAMVKAPDYCFRIGGTRKFFLETKKPSVNLKSDPHPAYQLRRYAWSAKLPLSILTDFEEFAVYDCRARPMQADKASQSRILYLTFDEYLQRWDEIAAIFAPDAILKGSFDTFADSAKGKRGTAEVDDEFLKEIESWREVLAKNIALRNPQITSRELNFAVQRTIDRLVFLRICEDRGIEPYGRLQALGNGGRIYPRLCDLFRAADDRYNSGLFHFKNEKGRSDTPDELSLALSVDDKVLKALLKRMYYPESPYEFSVLPADILGQVYERFLGKVIRLTAGHQAKIEEKPEVRKAGGVYYTPTYIVDYIVDNTVGKLLQNSTPKKASALRILDPACGSGSFLIGAYQHLLDWHRDWYVNDGPEKHARGRNPVLYQGRGKEWKLTTAERKRILLNNIYGVDIDQQAVEVTKLSLLLKVLEGESEQTLNNQLLLANERALPDLGGNIKCGNSLIGPDFYHSGQPTLFDMEETYRINAFDWQAEFPEILHRQDAKDAKEEDKGGFDAVIGNPPYGAIFGVDSSDYLKKRFRTFNLRGESYLVFIEKAISLLENGGTLGMIVPDTYLNLGFTYTVRKVLLQETKLEEVVVLPANIFAGATVDTSLLFAMKRPGTETFHPGSVLIKLFSKQEAITSVDKPSHSFQASVQDWYEKDAFNVRCNPRDAALLARIDDEYPELGDSVEMFSGVKVYEVGKGTPPQTKDVRDEKPFTSSSRMSAEWQPFFEGKHVGRYQSIWDQNSWIHYGPWLAAPRKAEQFEGQKILVRKIVGETLIATYCSEISYCNTLLFILKVRPYADLSYHYLLGVLNSRFIGWYYRKKFQVSSEDTFPQIMIRDILKFCIPFPQQEKHDRLVGLVERMLELNRQLQAAKTAHDKTVLQRQIDATDTQIDRHVYDLYGLTDDEIKIVEGGST